MERLVGLAGIPVLLALAWLLSSDRKAVRGRVVVAGLGIQFVFALLILRTAPGRAVFDAFDLVIRRMLAFTHAGTSFLFGKLYMGHAGTNAALRGIGAWAPEQPVQLHQGGGFVDLGMVFAIHVLPTIIFFSSLMAILYHLGVMQRLVEFFARVMARLMGTSGAESLSCAANIFVGQTEAPLVVRPYVSTMTLSELNAIMVGGFATVAGGVMAAYVQFGVDAGHLMAASVMSAPAALLVAKVIRPETGRPLTAGRVELQVPVETANVVDAAAQGAADGLKLALNVGAMLLAFIALVAMVDYGLGLASAGFYAATGLTGPAWSLKGILALFFYPLGLAMGVAPRDAMAFGGLLGTKISINEFLAYIDLTRARGTLDPRTYIIGTYALCGFANFSSIAIQIGGIGGMAAERKGDLARLGLKAMAGGAIASWLTAVIAGLLVTPGAADWEAHYLARARDALVEQRYHDAAEAHRAWVDLAASRRAAGEAGWDRYDRLAWYGLFVAPELEAADPGDAREARRALLNESTRRAALDPWLDARAGAAWEAIRAEAEQALANGNPARALQLYRTVVLRWGVSAFRDLAMVALDDAGARAAAAWQSRDAEARELAAEGLLEEAAAIYQELEEGYREPPQAPGEPARPGPDLSPWADRARKALEALPR